MLNMEKEKQIRRTDLLQEGFVEVKQCGRNKVFLSPRIKKEMKIFRYTRIVVLEETITNKSLKFSSRKNMSDMRELGYKSWPEIKNTFRTYGGNLSNSQNKRLDDTKGSESSQHISCWTKDQNGDKETENYLMWKAYIPDFGEMACRLQTTIARFIQCINSLPYDLFIEEVLYQNVNDPYIDSFKNRLFRKTDFYRHEQEVRFLLLSNNEKDDISIGIDSSFIEKIVLSPFATDFQRQCIRASLSGLDKSVEGRILDPQVMEDQ